MSLSNQTKQASAKPTRIPVKTSFLRAANPGGQWIGFEVESTIGTEPDEIKKAQGIADNHKKQLGEYLHSVLTTSNLVILAGSGTSLGKKVGGPSMQSLWENATKLTDFTIVTEAVKHPKEDISIESLLSRCRRAQDFLEPEKATKTQAFLGEAERMIYSACSNFLSKADIESHKTFLRRMARRRLRAPRLKLFTTNYDLCFEYAAGELGITVINGFSFSEPRRFDPRFFHYDLVRRAKASDESHDFVEGVVQLFKLHGSVNWDVIEDGIELREEPKKPCLIYPASTKYEQSYSQPHLELMSQFQAALREPNTCLVVIGFGFNDSHLSEPILAALNSNPSFKLLVVDWAAKEKSEEVSGVYSMLDKKIKSGEADIALLNCDFEKFSEFIPQLQALSPAEQFEKSVKKLTRS